MDQVAQSLQPEPQPDPVVFNREIEIKLEAERGKLQSALKLPALSGLTLQPRSRSLETIYYDTPDGALQKAGVALRVRRAWGRYIMTVKFPPNLSAGMFGRDEIEVRIASAEPDIEKFGADIAARIRQIIVSGNVVPAFATTFKRRAGLLESAGVKIVLSVDSGTVEAGGNSLPLEEIELELKEGNETVLYEIATNLAREGGLKLNPVTKAERGSLLASGASPDACKASVPPMPSTMVFDDYIAAVINLCIGQFVANWPAVTAGVRPEGVHQARVSLRRLRAMLGLFTRAVPAPEFRVFMAEAKQIAAALGPARDWDVFIDMVNNGPLQVSPSDPSFPALLAAAKKRRDAAYQQARKLVTDTATTCFVLELRSFAARRGWRYVLTGAELPVLGENARSFCIRTMNRLHKKAVRQGKQLAGLEIEQRHDLRKDLKRLPYAAEFCAPFFGGSRTLKRYSKAAGELQDVLGAYNDQAVAMELINTLEADAAATSGKASLARATGTVAGWCARGSADADTGLELAWEKFMSRRRFWS